MFIHSILHSFKTRLTRFLTNREFRHRPIRTVSRRVYWRLRRSYLDRRPFILPFYQGLRISLARSSASSGIYFNDGFSDFSVAQIFMDFLKPGMIAFDGGAHIGEYTLLFSKMVGPEGQVHSFEPDIRMFKYLQGNILLNNLSNVVLNELALSNQKDNSGFILQNDPTVSSMADFSKDHGAEKIIVPTISLDEYIEEKKIIHIDAIKLDVEGSEAAVISGSHNMLSKLKPRLIFIECDNHNNAPFLEEIFGKFSYEVMIRRDSSHIHPHLIARRLYP